MNELKRLAKIENNKIETIELLKGADESTKNLLMNYQNGEANLQLLYNQAVIMEALKHLLEGLK